MRYRSISLIVGTCLLFTSGPAIAKNANRLLAKGLEELSEANPAQQGVGGGDESPAGSSTDSSVTPAPAPNPASTSAPSAAPAAPIQQSEKTTAEGKTDATPQPPSKASKALSGRLLLASSIGWVRASKNEGEWRGSGSADLSVLYKLPIKKLSTQMGLWMGYHYHPVSVSGKQDSRSYRGVWEIHAMSTQFHYSLNDWTKLKSGLDLGYLRSAMNATDGLPVVSSHNQSAFSTALDLGCDWLLMEKKALAIGPKISATFGNHQIYRFSINTALSF